MGKGNSAPLEDLPWETRLRVTQYQKDDCNAAICLRVRRHCVIRGIRHHGGIAHELRGIASEFTRALKVCVIMNMNGVIADIKDPSEILYCIWNLDAAPQDTLRKLVRRYPNMINHAARACAVAGYSDLYLELQVLSEIHVTAKTRDASLAMKNRCSETICEGYLQIM
ncbi:hypothetical protein N7494_006441 [Penicillium frequentans]|uniref:Uncharacterized protein n=1 Tax=Penicillium frequentans TaxID=3151616 RepID=A0AAD6GGN5_9EURO|nr:hypothetical protein N7494_006441 [Penicillium glabrum]